MEGEQTKAGVLTVRVSLVQLTQHVAKRFLSGVATLLTFGVVLACHHLQSMVDNWSYSEPANPMTSLSTVLGSQPPLRAVEVWGLQSLKTKNLWGTDRLSTGHCGGVVCPLFIYKISTRTSIIFTVILYSVSFVLLTLLSSCLVIGYSFS